MVSLDKLEVHYKKDPIPDLRKTVTDGLTEHLHVVRPDLEFDYQNFEIPVYDEDSSDDADPTKRKVVGALIGHTLMKNVYIDLLWIDSKQRKSGIGAALMKKVEEFAAEQGFHNLFVDTLTFQAPQFYPKLGYREIYRVQAFQEDEIERIYFIKQI